MGWTDISITAKLNMLKIWNRIIRISDTRFIKRVFHSDCTKCKRNGAYEIKHVAEEIDQLDIFLQLNQFDLIFAQSKLHELFNSDWILSFEKNKKTYI